jgi:hypothetical protein
MPRDAGKLGCALYIRCALSMSRRAPKKSGGARYTMGARYLYVKRNVEKVWGARYTLGTHYLSKNTVTFLFSRTPRELVRHS